MKRLLTVKEVAEFLRVSPATVYRNLIRSKDFPVYRIGLVGDYRIDAEAFERWCQNRSFKP
jgi:excisionase family DNA binding protein